MFFITYLKEIIIGIAGFFALYLFNRNKTLKAEKEVLEQNITNKDKLISIQTKDIHATENIKPTADINSSIDRLSVKDK